MKRYPHTATVKVYTSNRSEGETLSESSSSTTIQGRFEPSEGTSEVKNPDGNYVNITGKFFTKTEVIAGADTLTFNGVEYKIIYWPPYQSYSEIWLD